MSAGAGPRFEVRVVDEVLAEDLVRCTPAARAAIEPMVVTLRDEGIPRDWLFRCEEEGHDGTRLDVIDLLRAKLRTQKLDLAEFMRGAPTGIGEAFDQHRERQRELNTAIARTERELDEAVSAAEAGRASEISKAA